MRQRLQWLAGLVLPVLAVALGAATHVALERRQTARHERDQATTALRQARSGRADRWAPEALARAEEANRRALGVMQAAEAHLPIFASYPEAARAWLEAGDAAREAAAQASASEEDMRRQCDEMISSAGRVLTEVQAAAEHARLEADSRSLLSRAQLALIESRILQRQEDYVGAMARAGWAIGAGNRLSGETANMTARYSDAELVATWSRWKTQLIARSRAEGQAAILIEKADHRLTLYRNGELVESFPVDLGPNWIPAKSHAGDSATPEGQYRIVAKKGRGATAYHRALLLNYPNERDRQLFLRDRQNGLLPPAAHPGGLIEIHGAGGRGEDWTSGCIAMTNEDIDRLYELVDVGTPVALTGGDWRQLYERIAPKDSGRPAEPGRPDTRASGR